MGAMTMTAVIISIFIMGLITFLLRAFPTFVPKRLLDSHLLRALNYALPLSVMTVLIIHSMGIDFSHPDLLSIFAKLLALLMVLFSYIIWRNVFLSVIVGVAALNGFLYILDILF